MASFKKRFTKLGGMIFVGLDALLVISDSYDLGLNVFTKLV